MDNSTDVSVQYYGETDGLYLCCGRALLRLLCYKTKRVIDTVSIDGSQLAFEPNLFFRSNKKVVLAAVNQNGDALAFASNKLKADKDVVIAAVCTRANRTRFALKYAADDLKDDKDFIMGLLTQNGNAFRDVSARLKTDKDVILAAVTSEAGSALEFVSADVLDRELIMVALSRRGLAIKNIPFQDKEILMQAVKQNGCALRYAQENFAEDREVVLAAVTQNGSALRYAAEHFKGKKYIVLAAVNSKGAALEHVSRSLKNDEVVVLAAVTQNGFALRYASTEQRDNRVVCLAAVGNDGLALKHCSDRLKDDKEIVTVAVSQSGSALEFASEKLRADKDVVCAAVSKNSEMLKYALGGLNQNRDCWIAAGLWNNDDSTQDQQSYSKAKDKKRVVLSTKFSLQEGSQSAVTQFTRFLNNNPFFQLGGAFDIYSPNAYSKSTCDPEWTRMDWPCRGTFDTCQKEDSSLKTGRPRDACCWRYSFRWHLEEARRTSGFMIQVVDVDEQGRYALGDGQQIETIMANEVGTKIFRIYRPRARNPLNNRQLFQQFRNEHVDVLVSVVQDWYDGQCANPIECEVMIDEEW